MTGLAEAGLDLRSDDLFLGTSSGARVALHLASGSGLDQLLEQQCKPVLGAADSSSVVDWPRIRREWTRAREAGGGSAAILRRVGSLALEVAGTRVEERRSMVASQLPVQTWPERSLAMVAVNVETGERRAFDRHSGVELVDAVMATTAFWGAPPVYFEGHHYIDGGFYSSNNADLAIGFDQVIIFTLRPPSPSIGLASVEESVKRLSRTGSRAEVVYPDRACQEALAAGAPTNPAVRAPVAKAGRAQGRRLAKKICRFRDDSGETPVAETK
jgi:NTE family protein